ncbi:MAG: DUF1624 domain-containing protein [Acidobacteria bacterium]|nr:DUF1624 domain-containing protein [Acidobacteriota bacterium]
MATVTSSTPSQPLTPIAPPSERLLSLDIFRGATIAAMILVNDPGNEKAIYWPLDHAKWNGWTPTDLIFPFFLFIVGVAMAFSFRSRIARGASRARLMGHVLWRGVVIFGIGLFLNGFPNRYFLHSLRIYGVLQRIAICYVISAVFALWMGKRGQIVTVAACLAGYWILMRYVPVPGFGVPTHDIPLLDPDRNLVAWLDRKVLLGHLYEGTRDPEGILSTIPALATSLLGVLTGEWLRSEHDQKTKAAGMLAWGVLGLAAGEAFHFWFPINKKLWTSSFVLFTAGFALVVLALCYWVVDIQKRRGRWTMPFLVFGKNSIAAYVFAGMLAHIVFRFGLKQPDGHVETYADMVYNRIFAPLASPETASLLFALGFVFVCWLAMWVLYRRGIFLKV